ncbi:uncharacterized protein BXZ73DRAFT_75773 [Epithele typhae]|uniref:uncharacterized protein n=1 Tax=Epithele typhae TaxID=378194 RepID=UPI002007D604|nr:uncharacterized protein BXZ73DRAFT_75773 [Epithele typhae]KAH9940176.1 hypothetical protein BXZ73DRAFT_75773 [Epithele typhae]
MEVEKRTPGDEGERPATSLPLAMDGDEFWRTASRRLTWLHGNGCGCGSMKEEGGGDVPDERKIVFQAARSLGRWTGEKASGQSGGQREVALRHQNNRRLLDHFSGTPGPRPASETLKLQITYCAVDLHLAWSSRAVIARLAKTLCDWERYPALRTVRVRALLPQPLADPENQGTSRNEGEGEGESEEERIEWLKQDSVTGAEGEGKFSVTLGTAASPAIPTASGDTVSFDCLDASSGKVTPPSLSSTRLLADEFPTPMLRLCANATKGEAGSGYARSEEKGIGVPLWPFAGEMGFTQGKDGAHSTIPPYATGGNVDTRQTSSCVVNTVSAGGGRGRGVLYRETPMEIIFRLAMERTTEFTRLRRTPTRSWATARLALTPVRLPFFVFHCARPHRRIAQRAALQAGAGCSPSGRTQSLGRSLCGARPSSRWMDGWGTSTVTTTDIVLISTCETAFAAGLHNVHSPCRETVETDGGVSSRGRTMSVLAQLGQRARFGGAVLGDGWEELK